MSKQATQTKLDAPETGVFQMSIDEYHAHPAVSNTGLGMLLRSPAHYVAFRNTPPPPTDAKAFGTAAHFGILQPELFYKLYVRRPDGREIKTGKGEAAKSPWATTEGKAIIAELSAGGTKTVLPEAEFNAVERIIEEVYGHPTASAYLSGGVTEQSFFWIDPETGVHCKYRPDYLRADGISVDVKTTQSARLSDFQRTALLYGYHRQAAFGMEGLQQVLSKSHVGAVNIAVESDAPHGIAVYVFDDEALNVGKSEVRQGLKVFSECTKTDVWPGYPSGTQSLTVPSWRR